MPTNPDLIRRFVQLLTSNAPEGFVPWLFPVAPNGKHPDASAIASRAGPASCCGGQWTLDAENRKSVCSVCKQTKYSWKAPHARLTVGEAFERLSKGGNVGIAARAGQRLVIIDGDDPETKRQLPNTLTTCSRKRIGGHGFCWADTKDKRLPMNIPTDDSGEVRAVDQYVVAPGSYVPVTENEIKNKVSSGQLTAEEAAKVLADPGLGEYTLEKEIPPLVITFDDVPKIFREHVFAAEAERSTQAPQPESQIKRSALYELKIEDVVPHNLKTRDNHPLHESETGMNFSVSKGLAHCWRHSVSLNPIQYLAVMAKYKTCNEAGTPHHSLGKNPIRNDNGAIFNAWLSAKMAKLIPEDDPMPRRALLYFGERQKLLTKEETEKYAEIKLPTRTYNAILEKFTEEYGMPHGRLVKNVSSAATQNISAAIRAFTDKLDMARQFVRIQPIFYDRNLCWWLWDIKTLSWNLIDDTDMLNAVCRALENPGNTTSSATKNEILEALRRVGRENAPMEMPQTWVQFGDTIVDIFTGGEFAPTPEYFCTNPIPWPLGENEETPTIDRIMAEWVGADKIIQLKEISAYCLLAGYPLHRIFALLGSGSNGKSCYIEFNRRFIGAKNAISTQLERMVNSRFEIAKLYRKLACIMGETSGKMLANTDLLKRASGGDTIPGEFKHKKPFDFANYAKIIIASNTLPPTFDRTDGFYRRWHIIDFPNKFSEDADILATIPEAEFANYARSCVGILRRLLKARRFTNEGSIEDRKQLYEEKSCPTLQFFKVNYRKEPGFFVKLEEFHENLSEWLDERGYNRPTNKATATLLRNDGIEIERRTIGGVTARWLMGVIPISACGELPLNSESVSFVGGEPLLNSETPMTQMSQMPQLPLISYTRVKVSESTDICDICDIFPQNTTLWKNFPQNHPIVEKFSTKPPHCGKNIRDRPPQGMETQIGSTGNRPPLNEIVRRLPNGDVENDVWFAAGLTEDDFSEALKLGLIFEPSPGKFRKI